MHDRTLDAFLALVATNAPPASKSWRTHCSACGGKKAKRWGEGRVTLAKYCQNEVCGLFGIPFLMTVQKVVTIDRLGRPHIRHKETAVRRRPTFTQPSAPEAPGFTG